jgi:hypothetical protein
MKRWAISTVLLLLTIPAFGAGRRRVVSPPPVPVTSACPNAILASPYYSSDITVDDSFVYFGDDTGGVFRVPKGGGAVTRLAQLNDETIVTLIVLDGNTLYLAASDDSGLRGTIYSLAKSGGSPTVVVSSVVSAYDLVVDANNLYWTSFGTPNADGDVQSDGKVERASKQGAGRTALASNLSGPTTLAVDDANVYFVEAGVGIGNPASGVRAVPKGGGTVRNLANGVPAVALTIDATHVFYSTFGADSGAIARVAKSGGASTRIADLPQEVSFTLRLFGDTLYAYTLTDISEGIRAISLTSGESHLVVQGAFDTIRFALDDCALYYVTFDDTVERTPR